MNLLYPRGNCGQVCHLAAGPLNIKVSQSHRYHHCKVQSFNLSPKRIICFTAKSMNFYLKVCNLSKSQLCAGGEKKRGACQGDSGSGLVVSLWKLSSYSFQACVHFMQIVGLVWYCSREQMSISFLTYDRSSFRNHCATTPQPVRTKIYFWFSLIPTPDTQESTLSLQSSQSILHSYRNLAELNPTHAKYSETAVS